MDHLEESGEITTDKKLADKLFKRWAEKRSKQDDEHALFEEVDRVTRAPTEDELLNLSTVGRQLKSVQGGDL